MTKEQALAELHRRGFTMPLSQVFIDVSEPDDPLVCVRTGRGAVPLVFEREELLTEMVHLLRLVAVEERSSVL